MTASSPTMDVTPESPSQPGPSGEPPGRDGEQINATAAATSSEAGQLEELLEIDLEVWLRHFGAC